jgi:PTH1 family peptidyl-tRNA hydrolase
MNLIVGLGNPGDKYASTRHNIGFMVVDRVLKDLVAVEKKWERNEQFSVELFKNGDLIFAKPQSFMNASGIVVKKLVDFYKVPVEQIWVIHDDIDLPLGKIRIRSGGGSAGHHGIESIIREVGADTFIRFRLGVGRGKLEEKGSSNHNYHRTGIEKYVVSPFTTHEEGNVRKLLKQATHAIEIALHKGLDIAMNEFN